MSAIRRIRRYLEPKILTAIALPALVVGVPVLILLILQYQSLNQFEITTSRLLEREATRLAEDLRREIRDDLKAPLAILQQRVDLGAVDEIDPVDLRRSLEAVEDPLLVSSFFVWSVPAAGYVATDEHTPSKRVVFFPLGPSSSAIRRVAQRPASREARASSANTRRIWQSVWGLTRRRRAHGTVYGDFEKPSHAYLVYVDYRQGAWEPEAFFGFEIDLERARRTYFPEKVSRLRDEGGRPMSTPEVSILDDDGHVIYRTGPPLEKNYVGELEIPVFFPRRTDGESLRVDTDSVLPTWTIRTGYPGTDVAALAHGRINQQRHLLLLVAVIAVVGISLASRATARELRLAELKSEFVSSVSHDLKTPLASIQMFAETLESGRARTPEKVREYGQVIGLEAQQLGQLIDGVLDFDKIESGSRRYPVEEIELGELVQQALECFEHQLQESGFATELDLPDQEVRFVGNREALLQVLKNLISNAVKYSVDDHYLRIGLEVRADNAVIEVTDHGIGVPPRERKQIFEKFYRATRDPTTDATGTGLGLAIARHVVRTHGGRIRVEGNAEEERSGSTFVIELPLWYESE